MQVLTDRANSLTGREGRRLATILKLTTLTGVVWYWTTHNQQLVYNGNTYIPAPSLRLSASKAVAGAQEGSLDIAGTVESLVADGPTYPMLAGGVIGGAELKIDVVDWRYPWAGTMNSQVYWLKHLRWTDEQWSAECSSLMSRLQKPYALTYSRVCRHVLGDAQCGIALGTSDTAEGASGTHNVKYEGVAVSGVTADKETVEFAASSITSTEDTWWQYGKITWVTGNNVGRDLEIKSYINTSRTFTFQLPLVRDIEVGDTFDVTTGCNKALSIKANDEGGCKSKFDNVVNFGGFPHIPPPDFVLKNPMGFIVKKRNQARENR